MENGVYQKVRKLHGVFSLTKKRSYPYIATIHKERPSRSDHPNSLSGRPKEAIQVWPWLRERDPENLVFPIEVISWCMTHEFLKDSAAVEEMIEQIRHPPYPVPLEAFRRQAEALCAFDALDRLKKVHATTLVLVGAEDILTPPWAARELAAHIASARLQVLDGGAHCPYWDIADRFNQAVIDFLTAA